MASKYAFPTQGESGGSGIPLGTGYVYQSPPGTLVSVASLPGGDLAAGSVSAAKIQGGTLGRLLYDGGAQGAWLGAGTSGWLLMSGGGLGPPAWTNTPSGLTLSGASNTIVNIPAATALLGLVPAANGGTNKASWTSNSVVVAASSTTLGEVSPGTSGWLLTSQGAGSPPVMAAPIAATVASAKLSGTYLVASTSYANVGVSLTLDPGSYRLVAEIRDLVQGSSGIAYLTHRLHNATAGAAIADSETTGPYAGATGIPYSGQVVITRDVDLAVASTIHVQAARVAGPGYTIAQIVGDAEGWTRLTAVRRA